MCQAEQTRINCDEDEEVRSSDSGVMCRDTVKNDGVQDDEVVGESEGVRNEVVEVVGRDNRAVTKKQRGRKRSMKSVEPKPKVMYVTVLLYLICYWELLSILTF